MDDKIIIDRMEAEEFLSMLMDAAKQDNPTRYYSTAQVIENIANDFKDLCKLYERPFNGVGSRAHRHRREDMRCKSGYCAYQSGKTRRMAP